MSSSSASVRGIYLLWLVFPLSIKIEKGNAQQSIDFLSLSTPSPFSALVGSLTLGTTFILSPVAGVITDKIGMRYTVMLGGLFTSSGMFLSSFALHDINIMYLTYGVMYGIGAALTYSPSLAVLGHYFDRYLGKVSGFATTGSSVFTAVMPFVYHHLLQTYGLTTTLRIIAILSSLIIPCAILYESPPATAKKSNDQCATTKSVVAVAPTKEDTRKRENAKEMKLIKMIKSAIYMDNWRKKRYVIWVFAITISQLGYFIPYVHMSNFVNKTFPGSNRNLPVSCIGIASGVGRLIFGFVADLPNVNRLVMHQISVGLVGVTTMILAGVNSYTLAIVCVLALGLCDGCYVTLMGPIAIEVCGPRGGSQAIGFLLGLCSIPLTIGPVLAGIIFDRTDSYTTVFLISGLSPIVATVFMFLLRCVNDEQSAIADTEAPAVKAAWNDNSDVELHSLTKPATDQQRSSEGNGNRF